MTDAELTDADLWENFEALWWSEIAIKGELQRFCDAACVDLSELEDAVDALCAAKARAEKAMTKATSSAERAERFAILASKVLCSESATLDAGAGLNAWREGQ